MGAPDDKESYVQEVGRAYTTNHSKCHRDELFDDMDSYVHEDMGTKCLCCATSCVIVVFVKSRLSLFTYL